MLEGYKWVSSLMDQLEAYIIMDEYRRQIETCIKHCILELDAIAPQIELLEAKRERTELTLKNYEVKLGQLPRRIDESR